MDALRGLIETNIFTALVAFVVAFYILAKCADLFVDGAIGIAHRLNIPKLIIGIVLVSLATTAPELSVSLMSAIRGRPEIALGNAIGSVICNAGLALALAATLASTRVSIKSLELKTAGNTLIVVSVLCFLFVVFDYTLNRWEGVILLAVYVGYVFILFRQRKTGKMPGTKDDQKEKGYVGSLVQLFGLFLVGLAGIIFSSEVIVTSAIKIASTASVPESVIALTIVAFGTSIPEVATCVISARKGEGAIAVGNIIGANILNICWVAGASSIANSLVLDRRQTFFMFPFMFVFVGCKLIMLRMGYNLSKANGIFLFVLYVIYLASFAVVFPMGAN